MPGHVPRGAPCLLANERLDPVSHQFKSDCGPQDFCGPANATVSAPVPASSSLAPAPSRPAQIEPDAEDGAHQAATAAAHAPSRAPQYEPDEDEDDRGAEDDSDEGAADGSEMRRRDIATPTPSTICQPRQCRRELHPFGYKFSDPLPPLCPVGRFCPDEGNECRSIVPLGGPCQFGRDEQCEPPPGSTAICLSSVCTRADAWIGEPCRIENTAYVGYLDDGSAYSDIVSRSNCSADAFYCAPTTLQCTPLIDVGAPCNADVSCVSGSCAASGLCAPPPRLHVDVPPAVFVVVAFVIAVGLAALLWSLQRLHVRTSAAAREMRETFWDEQRAYREAIHARYEQALVAPCPIAKESAHSGMLHRRSPRVAFADE